MKICYVAHAASIHVKRWLEYFRDRGHDVHVITEGDGFVEGVHVHRLLAPSGNQSKLGLVCRGVLCSIQTCWHLMRIRPDIVHAHFISTYGFKSFHL